MKYSTGFLLSFLGVLTFLGFCGNVEAAKQTNPGVISHALSGCTQITKAGKYVLTSNISNSGNPSSPCIEINDLSNVDLDCNGFTITSGEMNAIIIKNVNTFSINACQVKGKDQRKVVSISKSTNGTITNSTFLNGDLGLVDTATITVSKNKFNGTLIQAFATGNVIDNNTFNNNIVSSAGNSIITTMIGSSYGAKNRIINNTIDGKSDGIFKSPLSANNGADDGIVVSNETGDVISNNIIKNVWDAGIENTGFIFNAKISGNQITNAGICGIGGWKASSWKDNTVSDNIVINSPKLFMMKREGGLSSTNTDMNGRVLYPIETKIYFLNNTFTNNKLVSKTLPGEPSTYIGMISAESVIPETRTPVLSDFVVGNNTFIGNDFSQGKIPKFDSYSMIIDGGKNVCGENNDPLYPLKCSVIKPTSMSIVTITPNQVSGSEVVTVNGSGFVGGTGAIKVEVWKNGILSGTVTPSYISPDGSILKFSLGLIFISNATPGTYQLRVFKNSENYSNSVNFGIGVSGNNQLSSTYEALFKYYLKLFGN